MGRKAAALRPPVVYCWTIETLRWDGADDSAAWPSEGPIPRKPITSRMVGVGGGLMSGGAMFANIGANTTFKVPHP